MHTLVFYSDRGDVHGHDARCVCCVHKGSRPVHLRGWLLISASGAADSSQFQLCHPSPSCILSSNLSSPIWGAPWGNRRDGIGAFSVGTPDPSPASLATTVTHPKILLIPSTDVPHMRNTVSSNNKKMWTIGQ